MEVWERRHILVAMITWLLVLMMIAEGSAGLTCYDYGGSRHYPSDKVKCRAPDMNTYFNDGANLMTQCNNGNVSISFVWM